MGCETAEKGGRQKVVLDIKRGGQNRTKNEPFDLGAVEKGMLNNDTYNLMEQLEVESRSLWRIKNSYKNDSAMDYESKQLGILLKKKRKTL